MTNLFGMGNIEGSKTKNMYGATSTAISDVFLSNTLKTIIDEKLKDKFIMPFMEDKLEEVVTNFSCCYEETIMALDKYNVDGISTKYLSNLALLSLGVVNRGYYIHKDNLASLEIIRQLREDLLGKIKGPNIRTTLQASVKAEVTFDIRYIYYIQQHGLPPSGVFDPVKLAEFL